MKNDFNKHATHPLQTFEWGEFRKKTGVNVIQLNEMQITIHKVPYTFWTIGYVPKGPLPTKEMIPELEKIGKKENCIFIQLEPNIILNRHSGDERSEDSRIDFGQRAQLSQAPLSGAKRARMTDMNLVSATHPLFTKHTFILDLTKSEDELLKNMHPKTRYNIKVAQKHEVEVIEDNSDEAFAEYLRLTKETTNRQGFFAHTQQYHRLMWKTLKSKPANDERTNQLTAHLLTAKYNSQTLVAWILFVFKDTLYYPYGASSSKHREVMASNLMMWKTIKFGKKLGLKKFDMWGALGPNPDSKDTWYGFHRFKQGYGPKLVEFVGSYDLVINPVLYQLYKIADKLRWLYLKLGY